MDKIKFAIKILDQDNEVITLYLKHRYEMERIKAYLIEHNIDNIILRKE